jgi:carbonic anhydrase
VSTMVRGRTQELVRNAELYHRRFEKSSAPANPRTGVAVVTCTDARLNIYGILGLAEGDAHIIRNAGGVITEDVVRSLAANT